MSMSFEDFEKGESSNFRDRSESINVQRLHDPALLQLLGDVLLEVIARKST